MSSQGLFITIPAEAPIAIGRGLIVREDETPYHHGASAGGILAADDVKTEKKYGVGYVISVGEDVPTDKLDVGDMVMWQATQAFRIPNGQQAPFLWRLTYDPVSIICKLKPLPPEVVFQRKLEAAEADVKLVQDRINLEAEGGITGKADEAFPITTARRQQINLLEPRIRELLAHRDLSLEELLAEVTDKRDKVAGTDPALVGCGKSH